MGGRLERGYFMPLAKKWKLGIESGLDRRTKISYNRAVVKVYLIFLF